jgi:hypothetical protein
MAATQLTRTIGSAGNHKKGTFSAWIKKTKSAGEQFLYYSLENGNNNFRIRFDPETLGVQSLQGGSTNMHLNTHRIFRDPSAWYHIVVALDSSQGTASNRCKIYVNGVQETSFSTSTYPSQDANVSINESGTVYIGGQNGSNYFDGIMSHVHWVDGTAYTPTTFGETDATTGEWKIKTDPGLSQANYGTNGFFILKDGNSVTDQSGNSNNFTTSGTLTNTEDNPSNNFCVLNALQRSRVNTNNSGDYLKNGNTTFDTTSSNGMKAIANGNIGVQSGKWYWEAKVITNERMQIGISTGLEQKFPQPYYDETEYSAITMNDSGVIYGRYTGSAIDQFSSGTSNTANDILGFALDMDNKALYIHKNGTYLSNGSNVGVPTSGSSRTGSLIEGLAGSRDDYVPAGEFMFPVMMDVSTSGKAKVEYNFGNGFFGTTQVASEQNPDDGVGKFEYDVPANYRAISTRGINA